MKSLLQVCVCMCELVGHGRVLCVIVFMYACAFYVCSCVGVLYDIVICMCVLCM